MNEPRPAFMADLIRLRGDKVYERVRKLLQAGVPLARIFLFSDPACRCDGTGVIVEHTDELIRGYECPDCLGVAMIVVKDRLPADALDGIDITTR
jgi:hypothetical protein